MYGEERTSWQERPCMHFVASSDEKISLSQEKHFSELNKNFGIIDIVLYERVVYILLRGQDLDEILRLRNEIDKIFMEEEYEKGIGNRPNDDFKNV